MALGFDWMVTAYQVSPVEKLREFYLTFSILRWDWEYRYEADAPLQIPVVGVGAV